VVIEGNFDGDLATGLGCKRWMRFAQVRKKKKKEKKIPHDICLADGRETHVHPALIWQKWREEIPEFT